MEEHPVHISVDWNANVGGFPHVWLGAEAAEPFPLKWDAIGSQLKAVDAGWIRLNPFRSGLIARTDGDPLRADYAALDRLLLSTASAKINVMLDVSAPGNQNRERWAELLQALAQRYGKGAPYSLFRWEFQGAAPEVKEYYALFAKTIAQTVPERPLGFVVSEGDPVEAAKVITQVCSDQKLPLNSFAWTVAGRPEDAAQTIRRIRSAFSRSPLLKGTTLLPLLSAEQSVQDNTFLLMAARLADYAPMERANGLLGILSPLASTVRDDGELLYHGEAFALLNRLGGVRLEAHSDVNGVRCIATKSGGGVRLLVWREDREKSTLLGLLHLRRVPGNGSLRMENITVRYGSDLTPESGKVSRNGDRNGGAGSVFAPNATADITAENGEIEIALPVEPYSVALLTLQPQKSPPLEMTLSASRGQWFFGDTLDLDVLIKNTSRFPRKAEVELLGGEDAPVNSLKTDLGTLPPGAVGRLRFRPRITSKREGAAFLNVRASDNCRSCLAVDVLSPVTTELLTPRLDLESPSGMAEARIRLLNRTRGTISLAIRALRKGQMEEERLEVGANGKPVDHTVLISAPSRDAGSYRAEIIIEGASGAIATLTPIVGIPITCKYATLKPTVDGDLSEWTDSEPMGMGRADQVHDKVWKGPTDLSGYAYARWDEQFLYVACAVTDDIFLASFPAPELWRGDSVQFAFSADRSASVTSRGYGAGDHEFGMALLDGAHSVLYRFYGPEGMPPGIMKRGAVAVRREGTRTYYEAAIPWSELAPAKPKEGAVFGFSILINDNDGQGRGYISWSDGLAPDKRPLLFPPLKLVR